MVKLGLIGYPLSHSISAIIQKAAMESLGMEGSYDILETESEDIVDRVKFLKSQDYDGFNVTIPLKVPITLFLDKVDDNADIAGSANTVKILPDKTLSGFNTDIYGFVQAIPSNIRQSLKFSKVSILGTGGAARAIAVGLNQLGVSSIDFYTRNIINASEMVNFLRKSFPDINFNLKQIESLKDLSDVKMLVNSTPIGMKSVAMGVSPVGAEVINTMSEESIVYDIVYNPLKTKLLELAANRGLKTIQGLDMLVFQAAKAFEIWTGKKPDAQAMKIAALESFAQ